MSSRQPFWIGFCTIDESKMAELAVELRLKRYSKSDDTIDRFSQDIWNHRAFPKEHWKKIRTTNGLERINKELKRRTRVVGAFPNDGALLRLGVTILTDINKEGLTGRKHLSMIEERMGVDTRLEIYRKLATLPLWTTNTRDKF